LRPWSQLNYVLTRFGKNILENQCRQTWVGFEVKQCCQTFYLRKRFWDAICFTRMPVDFNEEWLKK
jgi:hypothetical protein